MEHRIQAVFTPTTVYIYNLEFDFCYTTYVLVISHSRKVICTYVCVWINLDLDGMTFLNDNCITHECHTSNICYERNKCHSHLNASWSCTNCTSSLGSKNNFRSNKLKEFMKSIKTDHVGHVNYLVLFKFYYIFFNLYFKLFEYFSQCDVQSAT